MEGVRITKLKKALNIWYYVTYTMFIFSSSIILAVLIVYIYIFMSCFLSFFGTVFLQNTQVIFSLVVIQIINFHVAF